MALQNFFKALDARLLQILFLGSFLTVGVVWRDFSLQWQQVMLTFAAAIATQWFWLRIKKLQHLGYLSAIVSSFGISILVRADNWWVHPLVACIAMSSKFIIRYTFNSCSRSSLLPDRPKDAIKTIHSHVFNPANLAAVVAGYALPGGWLSPGQWGQSLVLTGWFLALGMVVTSRAARWDVALAFLGSYLLFIKLRIVYLGINPAVFWHTFENGALLLFSFFMISDPMTTPNRRSVRIAFGVAVGLAAFMWQFTTFKPNGPIVALFALSVCVPLLNWLWPAPRFAWR